MTTLRRETKLKIWGILNSYYQDNPPTSEADSFNQNVAEKIVDAVLEISGIAKKQTEETAAEYNIELFMGDWRDYPDSLWKIAETLRDVWAFKLPAKPKKKTEKGQYAFYIQSMTAIKDACAEFGADVLVKVHADWKAKFRDGIAPYTVAQPTSLINVCAGKARELRDSTEVAQSVIVTNGVPETY